MMRDRIRRQQLAVVFIVPRLAAFSSIRHTLWGLGTLPIGDIVGRGPRRGGE